MKTAVGIICFFVLLGFAHSKYTPDYLYMQETTVLLEIQGEGGESIGHGSGVLLEGNKVLTAGHVAKILTSDKVVTKIIVRFRQGEEVSATLVKIDYDTEDGRILTDLALLSIDTNYDYPTASVSCGVQPVGTDLFMVGHPSINLWVTTRGYAMSVIPRRGHKKDHWLQIDGTIYRGNSGGPVFNRWGDIVGISSHILATNLGGPVGMAYAVSGPQICKFLEETN